MSAKSDDARRPAPIFILADEDREASARLVPLLPSDWYYIPVSDARHLVDYARQFATTAVFLAEGFGRFQGGTERLLQRVLDEVARPVVILVEQWTAEVRDRWRRMGAQECIPHPTRQNLRIQRMREEMLELASQGAAGKPAPAASRTTP